MTRARDLSNLIGSGNYVSETLTATAGQTAFTVTDGYTPNFVQVFMNGLLLDPSVDFTATTSPTITLTTAANAGDELEVVKYNTFSVGDAITQTDADTRYVNASGDTISGNLTVNGSVTFNDGSGISVSRGSGHQNNYEGGRVTLKNGNNYTKQYGLDTYYENFRIFRENQDGTGGVVRFEIDSAGRVTMPYQPAFTAYTSSTFAYTGNTGYQRITSWTAQHNQGSHFNTSNGTFTVPVTGLYSFGFQVLLSGVNTGDDSIHISFYTNGNQELYGNLRSPGSAAQNNVGYGGYLPVIGHLTKQLTANDTVDIRLSSSGTMSVYSSEGWNRFFGHLIG